MPKFRKTYFKAMESANAQAQKKVFKPTKKASEKRAQADEKQEKELYHSHWLHDLAFFEWLLDQPTDSGVDGIWDKFKRDWEGFTGDNFPATTHRQGPMVNQFKAIRRGKKRMFMKTTVREGRERLAEKQILEPNVKVIDYLRSMKGLPPRTVTPAQLAPAREKDKQELAAALSASSSSSTSSSSSSTSIATDSSSSSSSTDDSAADSTTTTPVSATSSLSTPAPSRNKKKRKLTESSLCLLPERSKGNLFAALM